MFWEHGISMYNGHDISKGTSWVNYCFLGISQISLNFNMSDKTQCNSTVSYGTIWLEGQIFLTSHMIRHLANWFHLSCRWAKKQDTSQNKPWLEKSASALSSFRPTESSRRALQCGLLIFGLLIILDDYWPLGSFRKRSCKPQSSLINCLYVINHYTQTLSVARLCMLYSTALMEYLWWYEECIEYKIRSLVEWFTKYS